LLFIFILIISDKETSEHELARPPETKHQAMFWVPKMKMIFALAALMVARTSKINKFYQPNSLTICQLWQNC